MKFKIQEGWRLGGLICPPGTIISSDGKDRWSQRAKGKPVPFDAVPLDQEAWETQLRLCPEHKHLLRGGLI